MAFKLKSGNSPLYNQLGTPPEYSRWQTAVEKFHEKGHGQSYTGKDIYQKGKKKRDEKRRCLRQRVGAMENGAVFAMRAQHHRHVVRIKMHKPQ